MTQTKPTNPFFPLIVWGLAALFFFVEYFARISPSVMVPNLMQSFSVGALDLGILSSFFYYPYILMQIPVGTLMDRYRPRRLLIFAALICGIGSLLFASAQTIWVASLARVLIGFGAAFAFVGALKIATMWFEPRRLGLLAGLTQGMGMLGAAAGEGIIALLVLHVGWRWSTLILASSFFLLALAILAVITKKRVVHAINFEAIIANKVSTKQGLATVMRNPQSWVNALYAGLIYAPTAAFAELWGPSYLQRTYGFSTDHAAFLIGLIFIGLGIGAPVVGWISDQFKSRTGFMFFSAFFSLLFLSIVLYVPTLSLTVLALLLLAYGFCNAGVALAYAVAGEINPPETAGISIALTNMASILIGSMLQPVLGWLLDLRWTGQWVHGVHFYSAADFRQAMAILPGCLALACVVVFFIRRVKQ